jgi:hypothetical protein
MQAYCKDLQVLDINGQFGKLTDRKEIPVPELAKGARAPLSAMSCGCVNRILTIFLVLQA